MDDSEKSYGYSEDIYHGHKAEKSYEYSPEGETPDAQGTELAPEEEAIHIVGPRDEEPVPSAEAGEYDYGRGGAEVESFTWENPAGGEEPETMSVGKREAESKSAR